MDTTTAHSRNRFVQPSSQMLRKCCGCVHLRAGAAFTCLFWMGFSMYLAILSFQSKSRTIPLIIFGVVNLLLTILSFYGLIVMYINDVDFIRGFSHCTWTILFFVLVDSLVNFVYFITHHDQYLSKCIQAAAETLSGPPTTNGTASIPVPDINTRDYYNCDRLFQDEVKFGLISVILMIILYTYWALCIHSYGHKKGLMEMLTGYHPGVHPPPSTVLPAAGPAGPKSNLILLNNQRPSKFSLKNLYQPHRAVGDDNGSPL
ncbi:hypothetical protein BX666DRAFT_1850740 [Dichotomocladium elegans]|nr:hypothetical protein BX666DRAFT_1850740 [Dichotomocladium elegans]